MLDGRGAFSSVVGADFWYADAHPHCVFFARELLLCGPELEADRVERIVREGAAEAARLLFGRVPVDFPVSVVRVRNYAEGK